MSVVQTTTLGDDFPVQQARVRKIQGYAREIGPAGAFLVAVCEELLQRADRVAAEGDVIGMVAVYQEMKDMKE